MSTSPKLWREVPLRFWSPQEIAASVPCCLLAFTATVRKLQPSRYDDAIPWVYHEADECCPC